jgi:hypothetical protein
MPYKARIAHLEESHKVLDKQIADMQRNHPHVEEDKVAELKKKKLSLKDEISKLRKLQFEEETQRVNFDDDR